MPVTEIQPKRKLHQPVLWPHELSILLRLVH